MRYVLAALVIAVAAAAVSVPPTAAHAAFVTATPAPDSTLAGAPAQVSIVFTEAVSRSGTSITVSGPGGGAVSGPTSVTDNTAVSALRAAGPGLYTVQWTNVSLVDGHEATGSFQFTVATPAVAPAQPAPSTPSTPTTVRPATPAAPLAGQPQAAILPRSGTGLTADVPTSFTTVGAAVVLAVLVAALGRRTRRHRETRG